MGYSCVVPIGIIFSELSFGGTVNPRNQSFVVTLLLIIAAVAMVVMAVQRESGTKQSLTINEVARDIKTGKIARVVIEDNNTLRIIYTDGDTDVVEYYKE